MKRRGMLEAAAGCHELIYAHHYGASLRPEMTRVTKGEFWRMRVTKCLRFHSMKKKSCCCELISGLPLFPFFKSDGKIDGIPDWNKEIKSILPLEIVTQDRILFQLHMQIHFAKKECLKLEWLSLHQPPSPPWKIQGKRLVKKCHHKYCSV
ncbi:hypothetical protein E2320_016379 [Naja naja]|nr:hypothetical protein E2320_016379 [Naja naja]